MEWSRRVEYHIFLIYQKLTVQDFNFQLFGILRVSTLRFGGSPLLLIAFYSNLFGRGVIHFKPAVQNHFQFRPTCKIKESWYRQDVILPMLQYSVFSLSFLVTTHFKTFFGSCPSYTTDNWGESTVTK